jgi:hypothetical protein
MRFYFPDSQDQVDPNFDFIREEHLPHRVRQRDDRYAHEVLSQPAYDGILVSKAIVDGTVKGAGKYTSAQRRRLYDLGVHRFFRVGASDQPLDTLGDCGAFAYIEEEEPPITVDDAIDFYEGCGFDAGISVDHLVPAFWSERSPELFVPQEIEQERARWEERVQITLANADEFLQRHRARNSTFEPVASAQGYSPSSYARSVQRLQEMGYSRIALGGMVPMKTNQIVEALEAVAAVRASTTSLHLLGVTRTRELKTFRSFGVTSFDSTSPFRQSFMDDTDNYHSPDGDHYIAIRVPPIDGNARLKSRIRAGQVDQDAARVGERQCLQLLRDYERREAPLDQVLAALRSYHRLVGEADRRTGAVRDRSEAYARTLHDRPWEDCSCGVCQEAGIEVVLFRGSERNKRRGFHNLSVFAAQLRQCITDAATPQTATARTA